jgi:hypothetical protein
VALTNSRQTHSCCARRHPHLKGSHPSRQRPWGLARKPPSSTEVQGKENLFCSANCMATIVASVHKEPTAFIFLHDVSTQILERNVIQKSKNRPGLPPHPPREHSRASECVLLGLCDLRAAQSAGQPKGTRKRMRRGRRAPRVIIAIYYFQKQPTRMVLRIGGSMLRHCNAHLSTSKKSKLACK